MRGLVAWAIVLALAAASVPAAAGAHASSRCHAVTEDPVVDGDVVYLHAPRPRLLEIWQEANDLDGLQTDTCRDETGTVHPSDRRVGTLHIDPGDLPQPPDPSNPPGLPGLPDLPTGWCVQAPGVHVCTE